jgi:anti-repressor protein
VSGLEVFGNGEFEIEAEQHPVDGFRVHGANLARYLGFRDAQSMVRNVPAGEKGYTLVRTPAGDVEAIYVTEAGFYRILGQRQAPRVKDEAARQTVQRFQDWVYGVLIPGWRKGRIPQQRQPETVALPNARELALMVIEAEDAKALLEAQVAELQPAAEAWRGLAEAGGAYQVGDAAKILCNAGHQMGRQRLFDYLGDLGWTFRGKSIDGTSKGPWHANQRRVDDKLLVEVPMKRPARDEAGTVIGGQVAPAQIRITVKGIEKLHGLLSRELLALPASK